MMADLTPPDPSEVMKWLFDIAPAAVGALITASIAAAVAWARERVNFRTGLTALAERFNSFEQRYERDEKLRLQRYYDSVAAQERLAVDLTAYRASTDAALAVILDRLGVPTDTHLHRRETDG